MRYTIQDRPQVVDSKRRDAGAVDQARLENPFGEALQATRNHRNAHAINGFIPEQYFSLLTRKSQ